LQLSTAVLEPYDFAGRRLMPAKFRGGAPRKRVVVWIASKHFIEVDLRWIGRGVSLSVMAGFIPAIHVLKAFQ